MAVETGDTGWLARRRRYRRLSFGMIVAGIIGFLIVDYVGYPVVGVVIYWTGFVGFFAVKYVSPVALFDERDCELERRASYDAVRLIAVVLIALGPGLAVVEETGSYKTPATIEGTLFGYVALFAVFGVAYLLRRFRP